MAEVVPPILTADQARDVLEAGRRQAYPPNLAALVASHEALRAERDAHWQVVLHTRQAARKSIAEANELRAELVVVRQALTDLLSR